LFVRKDLPLPQQLVQAAHAAFEMGTQSDRHDNPNFLVVFQVSDEMSLMKAAWRLQQGGISFTLFEEPDRDNEATSLCTEKLPDECKPFFKRYQLWRN